MARSFSITGPLEIGGEVATLRWEDGEWSGSAEAVEDVEFFIAKIGGVSATPTGPAYDAGSRPPHVALLTARAIFARGWDVVIEEEGDALPEIFAQLRRETWVPKGATP